MKSLFLIISILITTSLYSQTYPYLYGVSDIDLTVGGKVPYEELNILQEAKWDKILTLNGDRGYIYFAYPSSYGKLDEIIDNNGYNLTETFDVYIITVEGKNYIGSWYHEYYLYKFKTITTATNWKWKFYY